MVAVLILKNADLYSPKPEGKKDILCINGKIVKIGTIDLDHIKLLEIPFDVIDLEMCIACPGIIDPHQHIIGGSGERGYCSRSPEMTVSEIITGGITTVIGCIGVDTYTRNMTSLLAQAKIYNEEGITYYIWSGGYPFPPVTLTESIKSDMILVNEVIGAGELAISDVRSSSPTIYELAHVVTQAYIGGILTGKSGVTHFHVGDGKKYLQPLFELLENFDIKATSLHPTHVNRNSELLKQGAHITKLGVTIDFDTSDNDLIPSLKSFLKHEGDLNYLTLSSDASYVPPSSLFEQMREAMKEMQWPLEKMLPLVTTNTARILKLSNKGRIEVGADADLIVLDPVTFEILHVIANGVVFMRDSKLSYSPKCLVNSKRKIEIYGKKAHSR